MRGPGGLVFAVALEGRGVAAHAAGEAESYNLNCAAVTGVAAKQGGQVLASGSFQAKLQMFRSKGTPTKVSSLLCQQVPMSHW